MGCLIFSIISLICLHSFNSFFLFPLLIRWILPPYLQVQWFFLLLDLVYWWAPQFKFVSSVIVFFIFVRFFFSTFLHFYLLIFLLCWCIVLLTVVRIFMTIILNSLSAKLLSCFINICFWSFILFFRLEHILMFLHFAWLSVSILPISQTWEMFSSISSVMEWDHMGREDDNGTVIYCTNICYEIRNTISSK